MDDFESDFFQKAYASGEYNCEYPKGSQAYSMHKFGAFLRNLNNDGRLKRIDDLKKYPVRDDIKGVVWASMGKPYPVGQSEIFYQGFSDGKEPAYRYRELIAKFLPHWEAQ